MATIDIIIKATDKASKEFDKISKSAASMSKKMDKVGRSMTRNLTLPIIAFGVVATKAYSDFDKSQTNLQARTGATVADMELIRKTAIQMGIDTAFSATEASDAMLELMSSGSSVEETMIQLKPVLDLAAAGTLELKFAADLVTDVLAQFQLEARDSIMVVNSLAAAAQSSSATITDLGAGLANAGANMKAMGFSLDTTNAALAVLAEGGKKGSEAGTQLNSMLTKMSANTKRVSNAWDALGTSMFDTQGNMKDFDTIIDDINKGMEGMTQEEQLRIIQDLGGSYGKAGLNILLAADGIDTMAAKMATAQTAAAVAEKQMDSFAGTVNQLKGSFQTLMIVAIGPFVEEVIKPMVASLTELLNKYIVWAEANQDVALTISKIAVAIALIGPALIIIAKMISLFMAVKNAILAIRAAIAAVNFVTLMSPWGLALMALAAAIAFAVKNWDDFKLGVKAVWEVMKAFFEFMLKGGVAGMLLRALGIDSAFMSGLKLAQDAIEEWFRRLPIAIERLKKIPGQMKEIGKAIVDGLIEGIKDGMKAIDDALFGGIGQKVTNGFKKIFQISSPSKVTYDIGQSVGGGLTEGIIDGVDVDALTAAMKQQGEAMGKAWDFDGELLKAFKTTEDSAAVSEAMRRLGGNVANGITEGFNASGGLNLLANDIAKGLQQISQGVSTNLAHISQRAAQFGGSTMAIGSQRTKNKAFGGGSTGFKGLASSGFQGGSLSKIANVATTMTEMFKRGLGAMSPALMAKMGVLPGSEAAAQSMRISNTALKAGGGPGMEGTGTVNIENLNVPPGTTKEQIDFIMAQIAKKMQGRSGLSGRSVTF